MDNDGYLFCSAGSCTNGYRASDGSLNVAGGTSVSTPSFAAVVVLLNQKMNSRQGNVNPALYQLYSVAPDAFHDITEGGNEVPCVPGSANCTSSGFLGYTATPGYDQTTGLGTIDVFKLLTAWPAVSP